jgi:hypothetical protein
MEAAKSVKDQLNIDDSAFSDLKKQAFDALSDGELTFGEIVRLGGSLAGKANQLVQLSGIQKKDLVLRIVDFALQEVLKMKKESLSAEDYASFQLKIESAVVFVKETLPAVLDVAVDVARGHIDLKKPAVKKTCMSLLKLVFSCIGSRATQVIQEPKKEIELPVDQKSNVVPEESKEPKEEPKVESSNEKTDLPSEQVKTQEELRPANTTTE